MSSRSLTPLASEAARVLRPLTGWTVRHARSTRDRGAPLQCPVRVPVLLGNLMGVSSARLRLGGKATTQDLIAREGMPFLLSYPTAVYVIAHVSGASASRDPPNPSRPISAQRRVRKLPGLREAA